MLSASANSLALSYAPCLVSHENPTVPDSRVRPYEVLGYDLVGDSLGTELNNLPGGAKTIDRVFPMS